MFIFVNLFKVWPINLILIFCKHCACQLNLSTKARDTSTAKESCLCTCCFDHSEQLVPNITLEIFSSLEQKNKKMWIVLTNVLLQDGDTFWQHPVNIRKYAQIFTHCVSTKTYELVGIFQPKSTEIKTAWVSLDQYEATIKNVNPATIDNQMERNAKSHKFQVDLCSN